MPSISDSCYCLLVEPTAGLHLIATFKQNRVLLDIIPLVSTNIGFHKMWCKLWYATLLYTKPSVFRTILLGEWHVRPWGSFYNCGMRSVGSETNDYCIRKESWMYINRLTTLNSLPEWWLLSNWWFNTRLVLTTMLSMHVCVLVLLPEIYSGAHDPPKERLTTWNTFSAKFKLWQSPYLECTSTVWAVCYTHGKLAILCVCIIDRPYHRSAFQIWT